MSDKIEFFEEEYRFLSNFYTAPTMYDGVVYPSSEHAYVAAKTEDLTLRKIILNSETPGQVKRIGRQLKLRDDWEEIKLWVMKEIVTDKFNRNQELAEELIKTGEKVLVEGNWWNDTFWGVCKGIGQNHLGKILMEVREELRNNRKYVPEESSVWEHTNGNQYTVILIANKESERLADYPVTIIYQGSNGKIWARTLDNWYKSMKRLYPMEINKK